MAQGVGSATQILGDNDVFGGKLFGAVDYKGPASYVQGGDAVDPRVFGFPNSIIALYGSVDQSGVYFAVGRPTQNAITPWQLVWMTVAGGEVTAATNLSAITVRLTAIGI